MANTTFRRLLEPGYIGKIKTRNRIIKTGAGTFMWHQDELHMNKAILAYYESLARGGVGLLIVESPTIDYPVGARWPQRYRIDNDKYVPGLSELVEIIHKYDCPTFMQMNHDGPWQRQILASGRPFFEGQPIASSAVTVQAEIDFHNEMPKVLSIVEIEEKIETFVSAAARAKKAGFDGVDINAASSHLLHNFLSPFWNRREDQYGGSPENRARILTDIIKGIKSRNGNDFPISVCINGLEVGQMAGIDNKLCMTPDYSRQLGKILEEAGADAIQLRNHWIGYHVGAYLPDVLFWPDPPIPPKDFPKEYNWRLRGAGANLFFAAAMKKVVSIPVITVGRLDPKLGEEALRKGMADFVAMTRRLQADPDLPNKVAAGKLADIAPCTACENCLGSRRCRINAFMGAEYNTIEQAAKKKNVVVIGGGPAGMEAARTAALRGHEVTLFEKESRLGGLLSVAAVVKGSSLEDLPSIANYLERQIRQLGVTIETGHEFKLADLERTKPDVTVLAVGGISALPAIPGIQRANVIQGADLHRSLKTYLRYLSPETLRRLTRVYLPVGRRVVIIGGGIQGCELAEFLVRRGRKVTIVDQAATLGTGLVDVLQAHLFLWFAKKGVTLMSGIQEYVEINEKGLVVINRDGKKETIEADSIIPALPLKPNLELFESLKGKVAEVYAVGDCKEPLLIADAIGTGLRTLREL